MKMFCMGRTLLAALAVVAVLALSPATHAASPLLREIEESFITLGEKVRPSVVNIDVKESAEKTTQRMEGLEELFKLFGPDGEKMPTPRMRPPVSTGSGLIYDQNGHIITNNHVVAGADEVVVRLWDGTEYDAEVVGTDPESDLAVVKIEADQTLPVAELGDSNALRVGQFAIAVGSPRRFEGSFSFGHVTALNREDLRLPIPGSDQPLTFQDFIQTDAAINLGNSGGPVCDIDGRVIGISVAIVQGAQSLGFAIPINHAKRIIPELIEKGSVTRGYLGVEIKGVTAELAEALNLGDRKGAFVETVREGTPAFKAGVQVYDVIRKVDGLDVDSETDLVNRIAGRLPGDAVELEIWRDEASINATVVLERRPAIGAAPPDKKDFEILGMTVGELTPEAIQRMQLDSGVSGVVVQDVAPGSPAEEAGLLPGDVITEVHRRSVGNVAEFRQAVDDVAEPGKSFLVRTLGPQGSPATRAIRTPEQVGEE